MGSTLAEHSRIYSDFSRILDHSACDALPDDWLIGITDVVDSSSAIRRGAYQDVNYAGASVIAAVGNAWGSYDFPFTFAGDGAAFALPPQGLAAATAALQQVMAFARTDLSLTLRGGLLPVSEIRTHGRDVRIARYAASEHATYCMFAGGGLKWAERELKKGRYSVEPAEVKPDLTGLTCEWVPMPSQQGIILSLLVEPSETADSEVFTALARRVLAVFDTDRRHGNPVPAGGPVSEQKDAYKDRIVDREMRAEIAVNSDFRKYDDLLRLTLDCTEDQADAVEAMLLEAAARGQIEYGMHRQSHVLMTCLIPSGSPRSHLHFLDGMDGGYTKAAENLNRARTET
jgi:hypothetical protein